MIQIKLIPETACLMFKLNGELINHKFYNKFEFEEMEKEQFTQDAQEMVHSFLKTHISDMLDYYREHDYFDSNHIETLMQLVEYTEHEIGKLINKFHYINTRIADNGGAPVLKQILQLL